MTTHQEPSVEMDCSLVSESIIFADGAEGWYPENDSAFEDLYFDPSNTLEC